MSNSHEQLNSATHLLSSTAQLYFWEKFSQDIESTERPGFSLLKKTRSRFCAFLSGGEKVDIDHSSGDVYNSL